MVMMFIGLTLVIGITMGGLFFFAEPAGEAGIPLQESRGFATEPTAPVQEAPEQPQMPTAPTPPAVPQEELVPEEVPLQTCLQGLWTKHYVESNPEGIAQLILPENFKPYHKLYTNLGRDIFRIDTFNEEEHRFYVSAVALDKQQERLMKERKAAAQTTNYLEQSGTLQAYTILSDQGDSFGVVEILNQDPWMIEIYPRGNEQDMPGMVAFAKNAVRQC